ncbi:tail sheath protein [Yersinia phage vB_YenM_P744]
MSINIRKYVDITSGVGAGTSVKERELILRIFTPNVLVPAGNVIEFTSYEDVVNTFGVEAEESKRAAKYFGFISKIITRAKKISFAHYTLGTPVSPNLVGGTALTVIATWKAITDGSLKGQVGTLLFDLSGMDFSSASALADVAETIETKLQAVSGLATAVVTYDDVTQKFNATFNGVNPPAPVTIDSTTTSGTAIAGDLGWTAAKGMITSPGSAGGGVVPFVVEADEISDNYGSISFVGELSIEDYVEVCAWNTTQNVKYQVMVPVNQTNWSTWQTLLSSYSGSGLTLVADTNIEHDEDIPGIILGATDYNQRNASQNYMFQQVPGFSPKVDGTTEATKFDNVRVNYYGRTKSAGQSITFYQDGYLQGVGTSPTQMNTYANEQWFKAAATAQLLSLLLNLPIIPATDEGRAIVLGGLQDVITRAEFNGTIKADKELTVDQRAFITMTTGDPLAWHQVQGIGYWVDAVVQQEAQPSGVIKYIIDYTLIYSKADAVNKITGRDILI